ncbi:putative transcription factor C2H2 family [Helianthus annuus]|nr:putative transcription factor C2H2 family [Helianthus annuus]
MGDLFMNPDPNQTPVADPSPPSTPATTPPGFGLFLANHETPRCPIEDRIRFAVRVSARQPQTSVNEPVVGVNSGVNSGDRLKNHKRDITHVAKALGMDVDGKKTRDGVLFDCNMCLNMAKDPILTCCGHLFCWGCFYQVPYVDSVSKECPVCSGEVIDSNVTPVYGSGNGKDSGGMEMGSGVRIPPRPQARRVESFAEESSFISSVVEAVRRIRSARANSDASSIVVHASEAQMNAAGSTGLRLGGLAADGDVEEVDRAVSGSRRRRRRRR